MKINGLLDLLEIFATTRHARSAQNSLVLAVDPKITPENLASWGESDVEVLTTFLTALDRAADAELRIDLAAITRKIEQSHVVRKTAAAEKKRRKKQDPDYVVGFFDDEDPDERKGDPA